LLLSSSMGKPVRLMGLAMPVMASLFIAAVPPSANETRAPAQELHVTAGAGGGPSDEDTKLSAPLDTELPAPRGVPQRGVPANASAPIAAAVPRLLDRATIEARGRSARAPDAIWGAIAFNAETWTGAARRDLIAFLRGAKPNPSATFEDADIRVIAALQAGSGAVVDGRLTDPTIAVLFATGFRFSSRHASGLVELDFYPSELEDLDGWASEIREKVVKRGLGFRDVEPPNGEGRIYVRVDGRLVGAYRARGGPPSTLRDIDEHIAEPSRPGAYTLGAPHARVTSAWYASQIPWGAEIRRSGDGYQYRRPRGANWWWATDHPGNRLKKPLKLDDFGDLPQELRDGAFVWIWNKNDFGPIAWNLTPSDLFVHTTPDAEEDSAKGKEVVLIVSHGCVHIVPRERDEMIARGYLRRDVRFVVRRTEEHLLPGEARLEALHANK
jgi:hypothetical protein